MAPDSIIWYRDYRDPDGHWVRMTWGDYLSPKQLELGDE